ncbi:unnamed protein product, partial [Phaeothamnion confervicola]
PLHNEAWPCRATNSRLHGWTRPHRRNIETGGDRSSPIHIDIEKSGHGHLLRFKRLLEPGWPDPTGSAAERWHCYGDKTDPG